MRPDQLALAIPIIAIVLGIGAGITGIITSYLRKRRLFELYHEERMAAISKGVDLPPLPEALLADGPARQRGPKESFRRGLVWFLLGIALFFALPEIANNEHLRMVGLIPGAVGLGNLIYYFTVGRHEPEPSRAPSGEKPQGQS